MENVIKGRYQIYLSEDDVTLLLNAIMEYNSHSIRINMFKKEYLDECLDLENRLSCIYNEIYKVEK